MKLANLVAIAVVASVLTQSSVFAQAAPAAETPSSIAPAEKSAEKAAETPDSIAPAEKSSEKAAETPGSIAPAEKSAEAPAAAPVAQKKYSIGPAIQFGGGGTSFGITGKYTLSDQFSVRPLFLFGYKPSVTGSNLNSGLTAAGVSGVLTPTQLDTVAGAVGSGFAYGASVTYDFKSVDRKLVGYVGPRLLLAKSSGNGTIVSGSTSIPFTIDTEEVTIGLTAGADFSITPDLTAGLNATYNLYRGLKIGQLDTQNAGSSTNFGVNVTYSF